MSDNRDVEIRVFGSPEKYATLDVQAEPQIVGIVRDHILPQTETEYFRINVKVKRNHNQLPQYLIVYLLRKNTYTVDVVRVDLDSRFQVRDITYDYDDSEEEEEEESRGTNIIQSEYAVEFVVATPVPEIPTAKAGVEKVHEFATQAGFNSKVLLGSEASVENYKQYLTTGLKGFVNIGHGSPSSIVLDDGTLSAAWFNGLSGEPIEPAVIYFNSCQVFNDPLKPAVMKSGARTFIGGIVNLRIGPSEEVCKYFWNQVLTSMIHMDDALHQGEQAKYPSRGDHGITGDCGPFKLVTPIKNSAWLSVLLTETIGVNTASTAALLTE